MLARKAYRQRWKLPKIQGLAPAGDDAVGKFLGQHDIGIERQVRAMLLDRTDRQAKYRALAENLRDFRESKLADQSTRASVWHGRYHICLRMIFSENRFSLFEIMREPCRSPRAFFATKIATLPISSCQRGPIPIRIRWVGERSHEMIEPVPGPSRFRRQIAAVVGVTWRLKRHPSCDLNSSLSETVELGWVIGEQHDASAVEHLQHPRGDTVVALIIIEAESRVGINRVKTVFLHLVGAHLVGQTQTAALLRQIENDATAHIFKTRKREFELIAAVASPRAKYVTGEAGGVQAHKNRVAEVWLPDNDGDRTAAHRIPENDETCACTGIERHYRPTCNREGSNGVVAETRDRCCLDGDNF